MLHMYNNPPPFHLKAVDRESEALVVPVNDAQLLRNVLLVADSDQCESFRNVWAKKRLWASVHFASKYLNFAGSSPSLPPDAALRLHTLQLLGRAAAQ